MTTIQIAYLVSKQLNKREWQTSVGGDIIVLFEYKKSPFRKML